MTPRKHVTYLGDRNETRTGLYEYSVETESDGPLHYVWDGGDLVETTHVIPLLRGQRVRHVDHSAMSGRVVDVRFSTMVAGRWHESRRAICVQFDDGTCLWVSAEEFRPETFLEFLGTLPAWEVWTVHVIVLAAMFYLPAMVLMLKLWYVVKWFVYRGG